ncbi:MAG TPA: R3H domain-containing nucleic acid-binding protein, partial [Thermoanaerobaculia bacterium]|nr:R3H domain-containing nucleic acid-binding protein [Thermoanaerobaculia bacterium]
MNDQRRFFSGDTLQQALLQAANHFHMQPEEIAYRAIEKRHGFLRNPRKVLIEVDPESPRRDPSTPPPAPERAAPVLPTRAVEPAAVDEETGPQPGNQIRPERGRSGRDDRGNRAPRGGDRGPRGGDRGPAREGRGRPGGDRPRRGDRRDDRGNRGPRRDDRPRGADRGGERAPRFDGHVRPAQPSAERMTRVEAHTFDLPPANGLIALPEIPRRPSERFPEATGPVAEAAARGMELLLRIAGLELTPRILQGEERLEIDLSGSDVDWCFADDGEFVVSVEHLLPRLIRSLSGEAPLVRVDCDNFQEIREERLRSLAQRVAEEVRRKGRPRTLEPMNPADRRIVHMTLADDPGVATESLGDGYFKRVT